MRIIKIHCGISLLEMIISMTIIGIIFAAGSILVSSSSSKYFTSQKLMENTKVIDINIKRAQSYYISPLKNIHHILDSNTTKYIIATANTGSGQALEEDSVYMSQLVNFLLSGNDLVMRTYDPALNGGTDTLYNINTTDFITTTDGLIPTSTVIAKNVTSLNLEFLDFGLNTTSNVNDLSFIAITVTISVNNTTRTITTYLSPWRTYL